MAAFGIVCLVVFVLVLLAGAYYGRLGDDLEDIHERTQHPTHPSSHVRKVRPPYDHETDNGGEQEAAQ